MRRQAQIVWHTVLTVLLFAAIVVGMIYGETGGASGFWSIESLLLTELLAGMIGAVSG